MAIKTIVGMSGKVEINFCFEEKIEKNIVLNLVQVERVARKSAYVCF
jgi:hypothetical protein